MDKYREVERFLDYIDHHISNKPFFKGGQSTFPYAHFESVLDKIYEYIGFIFDNDRKNKQRFSEDVYAKTREHDIEDSTADLSKNIRDYFSRTMEPVHQVEAEPREEYRENSLEKREDSNRSIGVDSMSSLFSYDASIEKPREEPREEPREKPREKPREEPREKPREESAEEAPTNKRLLLKGEEMV